MSNEKEKKPKEGDEYQIPVEGSLGLLALGYRGVQAWRKVRKEAFQNEKSKQSKLSENNGE
jgi:hypothetical protein